MAVASRAPFLFVSYAHKDRAVVERLYNDLLQRGMTLWIDHIDIVPDGKLLASGSSNDVVIQIWDVATGNTVVTCTGHSSNVENVAWSPDGQRLASISADDTSKVGVPTFLPPKIPAKDLTWRF